MYRYTVIHHSLYTHSKSKRRKQNGHFNYILVCIIFGTTFLTIKIELKQGATVVFSRNSLLFSGNNPYDYFKLKRKEIMPHIFSKRIMYAGFCLTFMTFASLYWSEQYISSGLVLFFLLRDQ